MFTKVDCEKYIYFSLNMIIHKNTLCGMNVLFE